MSTIRTPLQKIILVVITIITAFIVISIQGCENLSLQDPIIGPTPDIPGYGKFPRFSKPFFSGNMNCSLITDPSEGMTWNGMTIGQTTYTEILETLQPGEARWNYGEGNVQFAESDGSYWFEACFIEDTVSAIMIFPYGLNQDERETIYDYSDRFGQPDMITWSWYPDYRTVLWAEEGIIADVLTDEAVWFGLIDGLVLIAPFSPLEDNQWLVDAVQADPPHQCIFDPSIEGKNSYYGISCCPDPFFEEESEGRCGVHERTSP